jgi:hypothetical protein
MPARALKRNAPVRGARFWTPLRQSRTIGFGQAIYSPLWRTRENYQPKYPDARLRIRMAASSRKIEIAAAPRNSCADSTRQPRRDHYLNMTLA